MDPGPGDQGHRPLSSQVVVQLFKCLPDLDRSTDGPQRIVLVDPGNAEDGEHGVADVLAHRPSVTLDGAADDVEEPEHDRAQRLRIELLAERRVVGDVGEQHRDDLPLIGGSRGAERGTAVLAELRLLGHAAIAAGTGRHGGECRRAPPGRSQVVR